MVNKPHQVISSQVEYVGPSADFTIDLTCNGIMETAEKCLWRIAIANGDGNQSRPRMLSFENKPFFAAENPFHVVFITIKRPVRNSFDFTQNQVVASRRSARIISELSGLEYMQHPAQDTADDEIMIETVNCFFHELKRTLQPRLQRGRESPSVKEFHLNFLDSIAVSV